MSNIVFKNLHIAWLGSFGAGQVLTKRREGDNVDSAAKIDVNERTMSVDRRGHQRTGVEAEQWQAEMIRL
jgi:hypothetical protein